MAVVYDGPNGSLFHFSNNSQFRIPNSSLDFRGKGGGAVLLIMARNINASLTFIFLFDQYFFMNVFNSI